MSQLSAQRQEMRRMSLELAGSQQVGRVAGMLRGWDTAVAACTGACP